jgi:hypothetical protein
MAANPQEFREFARECLRWANETQSERHRQVLREMSKTWFQAALELNADGTCGTTRLSSADQHRRGRRRL